MREHVSDTLKVFNFYFRIVCQIDNCVACAIFCFEFCVQYSFYNIYLTFLDNIYESGILSKFIRLSTIVIDYCVDFRLIYVSELSRKTN